MESRASLRITTLAPRDLGFDAEAFARAAEDAPGLVLVLGEVGARDLALDWCLRARALPGFAAHREDHLEAFALFEPPAATATGLGRTAWFIAAAQREGPARPWRFLRQLAASERHRPTAPHCFTSVIAVRPDAPVDECRTALLSAIEGFSASHAASTGVCFAAPAEGSPPPDYRPVAKYRHQGVSLAAHFRANPDLEPGHDPVVIPIEDSIDLHRFRPAEIADVVSAYLDGALDAGLLEVRIIHGRGRGVQRRRVHSLLERDHRVARFVDAPADRGGRGATLAWLKPQRTVPDADPTGA